MTFDIVIAKVNSVTTKANCWPVFSSEAEVESQEMLSLTSGKKLRFHCQRKISVHRPTLSFVGLVVVPSLSASVNIKFKYVYRSYPPVFPSSRKFFQLKHELAFDRKHFDNTVLVSSVG